MTNTVGYPKPETVAEWSINQITEALSRPLPDSILGSKKMGGQNIKFLPWYQAVKILDKYAIGWQWEVKSISTVGDRLYVIGELSIPTSEGTITRAATGNEELNCSSYGDPSSNAESMALRRAAAKFGLGLHLYQK